MFDPFTVTILVILAFLVWVIFSKSRLASTIRMRFKSAERRAAEALDDAVSRVEAAEVDNEDQLAKSNEALIQIKTMRKAIANKCSEENQNIAKYEQAAENAASIQREDLVEEALTRKQAAENALIPLSKQLSFLMAKESEVQNAVDALNKRKAMLKRQKVEIKTRAKTAVTTLGVNELLAGVDLSGKSKDVERAFEIVEDLEAKSGAMAEIAEKVTAAQKMEEELESLSMPPQTDIEAETAALMAKYQQSNKS